ncbi:MAG: T9SS type A sorting domain-containing protein [Saprospiraceae bacterium]|nr:T9SS type A sorting domain-containing protein [Candidatus Vicinibacter proximus]
MVQSKSLSKDLNQLGGLKAFCKGNIQILTSSNSYEEQSRYIPIFNCEEEEFGGQQLGLKQFIPVGIYPNPSTGIVLIDCDINAEIIQNVRISDLYGRHQIHRPILNKHGSIGLDFSSLSSGIYIVELLDVKGKTISTQRLMIHR